MQLKRTLSLLFSLAMVLGMLSGCGGKQASSQPDTSDYSSKWAAVISRRKVYV